LAGNSLPWNVKRTRSAGRWGEIKSVVADQRSGRSSITLTFGRFYFFFCGVFIVAVAIAIKLIIKGKIRFFLGSREFGFLQRHLPAHYELKQKRQF
jgi:hypothetical protein